MCNSNNSNLDGGEIIFFFTIPIPVYFTAKSPSKLSDSCNDLNT